MRATSVAEISICAYVARAAVGYASQERTRQNLEIVNTWDEANAPVHVPRSDSEEVQTSKSLFGVYIRTHAHTQVFSKWPLSLPNVVGDDTFMLV